MIHTWSAEVKDPIIVVCVGGNYKLGREVVDNVRAAIFGKDWWSQPNDGIYIRSMDALRAKPELLASNGVPVWDERGWKRPELDILLDLQLMTLNTPARFAIQMMDALFGDDAIEMLRRFYDANIVVSNQAQYISDVNRIHQRLGDTRIPVKHPDAVRAPANGEAA